MNLHPEDLYVETQSLGLFGARNRIKIMHKPTKIVIEKTFDTKIDMAKEKQLALEELAQRVSAISG